MSEAIWGPLLSAVVVGLGSVLVYFQSQRATRVNEKKLSVDERTSVFEQADDLNRYIDARVERAVAAAVKPLNDRIEKLERREETMKAAVARIFRSIARAWPPGFPRPRLDPADIAILEETIPHEWLPGSDGAPEQD